MKRGIAISILLLATLLIPASFAAGAPEAVSQCRTSVLRVYCDTPEGYGIGSAFVIGRSGSTTYLVTNLHVVSNLGDYVSDPNNATPFEFYQDTTYVLINDINSKLQATAYMFIDNLDYDLALLEVEGLDDRPILPLTPSALVKQDEACYAAGFPFASDSFQDGGADSHPSSPENVTISDGIISKKGGSLNGQDSYQHTANIYAGNSGGPLLNERGEVIAVNTWTSGIAADSNMVRSIYIDYIIDFAQKLGLPITLGKGVHNESPQDPSEPPNPSEPDGEEEENGSNSWVYISAGIGAVVIGYALTIAVRKKKSPVSQVAPSFTPEQIPVGAGVIQSPYPGAQQRYLTGIRGTGGQYNTISFPIPNKITLGRDPKRCTVIFAAQTAGVSGLHCEVIRQGDSLQLIDRGSSYGTFLDNGTKLLPNIPVNLSGGQGFYLGDRRNSFTVY